MFGKTMYKIVDGRVLFVDDDPNVIAISDQNWIIHDILHVDKYVKCPGECEGTLMLEEGDYFKCYGKQIKCEDGYVYYKHV